MQKEAFCLLLLFTGVSLSSFAPNTRSVLPRVVRSVSLTNQTNPIASTTLLTPTANALYRVSVYMVQQFPQTSACGNACGVLVANFQWTDDGGTQVMSSPGPGVALNTPIAIQLAAAAGQGIPACAQTNGGTCIPAWENLNGVELPGATFVVHVNAGTPLIYSVTGTVGSGVSYDFFLTVEQLQ